MTRMTPEQLGNVLAKRAAVAERDAKSSTRSTATDITKILVEPADTQLWIPMITRLLADWLVDIRCGIATAEAVDNHGSTVRFRDRHQVVSGLREAIELSRSTQDSNVVALIGKLRGAKQ